MSSSPTPLLGVDLSTAAATMALLDVDGRARVIPNAEGHDQTPTAVHFYDTDGLVIGEEAVKMTALDPENTVRYVPTWLGDRDRVFELQGLSFSAQELLALLLIKLREDAAELRGQTIEQVVVSVPSWFDAAQRQAVRDAALIWGLEVLGLYPRSTAAVIGHGMDLLPDPCRVMVINLGGTAFEAAVLQREGETVRCLASRADAQLGRRDFEHRLSEHLALAYEERHGYRVADDENMLQQFVATSQFGLDALATKAQVTLQIGHGDNRMNLKVSREQFSDWTYDLVHRAHRTVQATLAAATTTREDIDETLIVGSAARLHGLQDAVANWMGKRSTQVIDPHTVIARGVAIAGAAEHQPDHPGLHVDVPRPQPQGEPQSTTTSPLAVDEQSSSPFAASFGLADGGHAGGGDTSPLHTQKSIGIIALDRNRKERVVELIPRGTPLPYRFRGRFVYAFPNMTAVRVEVTEGIGQTRQEVEVVGRIELDGLPPRPQGTPIEVVYVYGVDQELQVRVVDVATGRWKDATLQRTPGLSSPQTQNGVDSTLHL